VNGFGATPLQKLYLLPGAAQGLLSSTFSILDA
jgi:hypothetical protein